MNWDIARRVVGWGSAWGLYTIYWATRFHDPTIKTIHEVLICFLAGAVLATLIFGIVIAIWYI